MKPLSECRLYAFIDTTYLRGRAPELIAQQLCDGGADLIQLRAKTSTLEEIRRMANAILPITRKAKVSFVINDHLSVAWEIGAEYCHLGQEDFFDAGFADVAHLKPPAAKLGIGLSTHKPDDAVRAIEAGADYIGVGPVYATGTKLTATPVTLHYVRWAAENVRIPWFAIGGINQENLSEVLAAGAQRICVVSAILNHDDVAKACAEFRKKL